jgi:hypothetical protein
MQAFQGSADRRRARAAFFDGQRRVRFIQITRESQLNLAALGRNRTRVKERKRRRLRVFRQIRVPSDKEHKLTTLACNLETESRCGSVGRGRRIVDEWLGE